MTTNGVLLKQLAPPLAEAGLQRVNVCDRHARPAEVQAPHPLGQARPDVWDGIQAAEAAGLVPIKLNAVVVRGYNETTWSTWRA